MFKFLVPQFFSNLFKRHNNVLSIKPFTTTRTNFCNYFHNNGEYTTAKPFFNTFFLSSPPHTGHFCIVIGSFLIRMIGNTDATISNSTNQIVNVHL